MKMMDCVEVIVEKESYARDGVHLGMQGWICLEQCTEGYWLVNFPQYGEKDDIAEIDIREEDLKEIPVMDARVNEKIKAEFDALSKQAGHTGNGTDDNSAYMI